MSSKRKEQLVTEISQLDTRIDKEKARLLSQFDHLSRVLECIHRLQLNHARLEHQLRLLDTDTVYIHIMTDYAKHRVCRVMKGTQPSHHDHLRFFFTDDGKISVETHGVRIPLHIGSPQWIKSSEDAYMMIPFFFRSEANNSIRLHTQA